VKKIELELLLQQIQGMDPFRSDLEQYQTPASIASEILFLGYNDVHKKVVIDLGCGTGIFSIGCALLGASKVFGIDIDKKAVEIARRNAAAAGVNVHFLMKDVCTVKITGDTVVMNPPFGAQKENKNADSVFLKKAIKIAPVVYSIHLKKTIPFLRPFISSLKGEIALAKEYSFPIKKTFSFHEKKVKQFEVVMLKTLRL
jgi:putative methylase